MKITVNSSLLLKKLQLLLEILPTNSSLPITHNFLFETKDSNLYITATDLDIVMKTSITVIAKTDMSIAIPGKLIVDVLKALPNQPLDIEVLENSIIEIKTNTGVYVMPYELGSEFPKNNEKDYENNTTIHANSLNNAIANSLVACATDDFKPALTGVYFDFKENDLNVVSTDAHKLIKYTLLNRGCKTEFGSIVSKKTISLLKKTLSLVNCDVEIKSNKTNICFLFDDYTLTSRLIDATYPKYDSVIPTEHPFLAKVERALLLQTLKRVLVFSNHQTKQVEVRFTQTEMRFTAQDASFAKKAIETIESTYNGDQIDIGFNTSFFIEALGCLSTEFVQIKIETPTKPVLILPVVEDVATEEILILLMPTKIN